MANRIILVLTLVIYILAGRVIFNLRGSLRRFAGAEESSQRTSSGPTRDTLGCMVPSTSPLHPPTSPLAPPGSPLASPRSPLAPTRSPLAPPGPPQAPGGPVVINTLQSYSCTVSSGYTVRTRNSGVEANTAAWAYCRCAMLFFLALVITWVFRPFTCPPSGVPEGRSVQA